MIKVAVIGAAGRMGQAVLSGIEAEEGMTVAGALVESGDPLLDKDVAQVLSGPDRGIAFTAEADDAVGAAQVAIDFTLPHALEGNLAVCLRHGVPLVVGTTGLGDSDIEKLERASQSIPIVYGRNMSIGVNVFTALVGQAARLLREDYDAEITEAHHRHKVDAPSGTAFALGEAVAANRGRRLADVAVGDRQGRTGPRNRGDIGFSVIRAGSIVGEHRVLFASDQEQVELVHRAQDRGVFAAGALRAARWAVGEPPGLYGMADVLGL